METAVLLEMDAPSRAVRVPEVYTPPPMARPPVSMPLPSTA
jgi:hypothetical protein